jgi:uncharacterized membrane protein
MPSKIKKTALSIYYRFFKSISMMPSLISILFVFFAVVALWLDNFKWMEKLLDNYEIENSAIILTTLLTGIISLTIFSFSMVMVVLNQAASMYTPKVLSLIVEQRSNQFVLGFYIGTILFYIIILIFNPATSGLTFYLSVLFAVICIILFVNFIHSVSISIQVKNIIQKIFGLTKEKMQKLERKEQKNSNPDVNESNRWFYYESQENGYFQKYLPDLIEYLQEKDLILRLEAKFGEYLLEGNVLFSVNKEINEETREEIQNYLFFNPNEDISEHSFYGFYQLTEIAVKALSPGINDPGTALICIDYLINLFSLKAANLKNDYVCDRNNVVRLIAKEITIQEVFYHTFTPIREYGRNSITVFEHLLNAFQKLAVNDLESKILEEGIIKQAEALVYDADESFSTPLERGQINKLIKSLNDYPGKYFNLKYLSIPHKT